jgi:SAM-dependent methyltransferase
MKILDATAGMRGIWYQKNHPFVTFLDIRKGVYDSKTKNAKFSSRRRTRVNPDVVADWCDVPFPDNHFDMVIFDPPHIFGNRGTVLSGLEVRYGKMFKDNWKQIFKDGIKELFRVLKPKGVFILKWCESHKSLDEILSLFPYKPMVGTRTGQANKNHWVMFLKYDVNMKLTELQI